MDLDFRDEYFEKLSRISRHGFLKRLTDHAGVTAVNFVKQRFVEKNWKDNGTQPWEARKRKGRGSLLTVSGRLKRSIRKIASGNYFVYIGTDVPYAQVHNEGGETSKTVNVRSHQRKRNGRSHNVKLHTRTSRFKVPKRQFLGDSQYLARGLELMLKQAIDNELNQS
ncbi:phage virion morphogenesis protein [Flavobacterium covae]|uniref:phage virion morphogenesis protein n=1 Tax=Flavobacterium covae TaxID=2906076 RepID=UPI0035E45965